MRVANRKLAAPQTHPTEKPAGIRAGLSEADIEAARLIVADADPRTSNFPRRTAAEWIKLAISVEGRQEKLVDHEGLSGLNRKASERRR
jgi:hypothetical protein